MVLGTLAGLCLTAVPVLGMLLSLLELYRVIFSTLREGVEWWIASFLVDANKPKS